jgi:DNA-binding response OmpR family regulator
MKQVILIVEGNVHAGKLYKAFIERSGHQAMVTNNAEKAVKLARMWQPDLVMIDMHLASKAPTRLIEELKHASGASTHLVVTCCDNLETASSLAHHVDAIIPKPFDYCQLSTVVNAVLNRAVSSASLGNIKRVETGENRVSAFSAA